MNLQIILDFLRELEENNQREWYHDNKAWYRDANREFEALIAELMEELRRKDPAIPVVKPNELTFKQNRDTRFSHDKSPYLPAFRAHIGPKGKLPIPVGYYLHIRPGDRSFLGGGLFADMFRDATTMVRDHIASHGDEWQALISDPGFTTHFSVGGTALKNIPRGYAPEHPQGEYLKHKSWYLEVPLSDEQLLEKGFFDKAVAIFEAMQPFNAFLNQALAEFEMPTR